jgi:hypothetical protein
VTEWHGNDDDFAPEFVDTVTSRDELPHRSVGLITFSGLVAAGLVVLLVVALGSGDGPAPLAEAAETPPPIEEPIDDPSDGPSDDVAVLEVGVIGASTRARHAVTTDGENFCLQRLGDQGARSCSPMSASPFLRGLLVVHADVGPIWCGATAVSSQVTGVTAEFTDGTTSRLALSSPVDGTGPFAAVCRGDGAGLVRLVLFRDESPVASSGGPAAPLVATAVVPDPAATLVTVPPGWHQAQIGRFAFVASAPIRVAADPSPGSTFCTATQFAVLSVLPDDAVLVAITELRGAIDLPPRASIASTAPLTLPSLPACIDGPDVPVVRAVQFAEAGRQLEVAVVGSGGASPADLATAVHLADSLAVVPDESAIERQEQRPPSVGAFGAAGAWTGQEVLLWGGEQPMLSSVFDPGMAGVVSTSAAPEPYSNRVSTSGGRFDPTVGVWQPMAPPPESAVGGRHGSVWADDELFLWGSELGDGRGFAYRPTDDTWRPLTAPIGGNEGSLHAPVLLWTGDQVLLFGQVFGPFTTRGEVITSAYTPGTDTWSPIPFPSDLPRAPMIGGVWTGTEAVLFVGDGRGMAFDPRTTAWRTFDGPVDAAGASVTASDIAWNGDQLQVMSRDVSSEDRTVSLYSAVAPFDRWTAEQFPPTSVSRVDTVVAVDGGLLAIGPVVDSTTFAPRPPVGWFRRDSDGDTTPLAVPREWNRCGATQVSLPGEVLFWGGTECEAARVGVTNDSVSRVSVPAP